MTQTRCVLISQVKMAEYGSSQYSCKTDNDYDLSLSPSSSSEAREEIDLLSPPLEIDLRLYRFEPVLPPSTDHVTDDGIQHTAVSEFIC